jgi:hypothetical protein
MKAHGAVIGIILPCTAPDIVSRIAHLGKIIAALHALAVSRMKYSNLDIPAFDRCRREKRREQAWQRAASLSAFEH